MEYYSSLDIALATNTKRQAFASILSGLLLALCYPHADMGLLAWVALVPFFLTFPHTRMRTAVGCGYLLGFVQAVGVAYWMGIFAAHKVGAVMGVVAMVLAAAIHAPMIALLAVVLNLVWRTRPLMRLLAAPAAWVVYERLAEIGTFGMGWGDLGYSQWRNIPILQISSLAGVFGIGFLIVFVNVALASRERRQWIIAAVVMAAALAWGACAARIDPRVPTLRVASIQGNVNEDVVWSIQGRPVDANYFYRTLSTFDRLLLQAARQGARFAAIPETAIPGYIQFDPELHERVEHWATESGIAILAGGRYYDELANSDKNVVFMISPIRGDTGMYAKTKLVPFGEYLPYRKVFSFLKDLEVSITDMGHGSLNQPPLQSGIDLPRVVVGPMICFESTYSSFARRQAAMGATLLSVVTDDAWFGQTAAARQHLEMSAIRAAETHRALVRSGATGISAIFDSRGRLLRQLPLFKQGIIVADVSIETTITPYVRYGDLFVFVCGIVLLAELIQGMRQPARA